MTRSSSVPNPTPAERPKRPAWSPAQTTAARMVIDRLLAPRRLQVRQAMLRILLESGVDPMPSADDVLARVHDLCAKELAERVRIAAGALRAAYATDDPTATDLLLEELRGEVEACITESMADLVDDERLAASILGRLPSVLTPSAAKRA